MSNLNPTKNILMFLTWNFCIFNILPRCRVCEVRVGRVRACRLRILTLHEIWYLFHMASHMSLFFFLFFFIFYHGRATLNGPTRPEWYSGGKTQCNMLRCVCSFAPYSINKKKVFSIIVLYGIICSKHLVIYYWTPHIAWPHTHMTSFYDILKLYLTQN